MHCDRLLRDLVSVIFRTGTPTMRKNVYTAISTVKLNLLVYNFHWKIKVPLSIGQAKLADPSRHAVDHNERLTRMSLDLAFR